MLGANCLRLWQSRKGGQRLPLTAADAAAVRAEAAEEEGLELTSLHGSEEQGLTAGSAEAAGAGALFTRSPRPAAAGERAASKQR
jgi:hypothetical protein